MNSSVDMRLIAEQEISRWLCHYMARLFNMPIDKIDKTAPFEEYGVDSSTAVGISGELGEWIGCNVDPAAAYDHPSIGELAHALAADAAVRAALHARTEKSA